MAIIGLVLEGIALLVPAIYLTYEIMLIAMFILGLGISLASVGISTLYQTLVTKDKMGRVMSITSAFTSVSIPLGTTFGSMLITVLAPNIIFAIYGLIVLCSGLSLVYITQKRKANVNGQSIYY
jgi:MFS transporter, DHA3 family, macrolide efflux protein